jgi:hypothetical protein
LLSERLSPRVDPTAADICRALERSRGVRIEWR